MGQKVSPHGLRVGVIKDWDSKWYAGKDNFAEFLAEDNKIRKFIKKSLYGAGVARILIERAAENKMKITVLTARPGMVIGRSGAGIDELKKNLEKEYHDLHRRGQKKRTGRSAYCREHRRCAGAQSLLQKSNEAGDRQNDEGRCEGSQGSLLRKTERC